MAGEKAPESVIYMGIGDPDPISTGSGETGITYISLPELNGHRPNANTIVLANSAEDAELAKEKGWPNVFTAKKLEDAMSEGQKSATVALKSLAGVIQP